MLFMQAVSKGFILPSSGYMPVLSHLDFELREKEICAVIGASGSGKSTFLSLASGLASADSGSIQIAGQETFSQSETELARIRSRHVSVIFQQFHLVPHLSCLENVSLPLELLGFTDSRERSLEALERVGLSHRLSHYPHMLSGGEKQRTAIARSVARRPDLILADEPTGSLDPTSASSVANLLFEVVQEYGLTMILVTHSMSLARRCPRVLQLKDGKLHDDMDSTLL